MGIPLPSGIIPVKELSTGDRLYGDRVTGYRWEVLTHDSSTGVDSLAGILDGVDEESASLSWTLYSAVKGSGKLRVTDLAEAAPGSLRIADVPLASARIRPVLLIDGLPEIPLGVYLFSAAPEQWTGSGRSYDLELLDRNTVLDQDLVEQSYTFEAGTVILEAVAFIISEAGEAITVDGSNTDVLANPMTWPAGTSRLQIVNDLLGVINFNSLWVDGVGNYRTTPYVVPAARSISYELLNLKRELLYGPTSIYSEEWSRDRDLFKVPNKVLAIQSGSGDAEPLIGVATNETTDPTAPTYPFSYASRGRWITKVLDGVDVADGSEAEMEAALNARALTSLIASSSIQASVSIKHLPLPLRVGDVLRFANPPAGIDARHVVTSLDLEARPKGLMTSKLQEVVDL